MHQKNIITAPKPPQPIPGGIAGPGLLAQTLVSHHVDHLPFHRQERIYGRHGLPFSRQTTDGWSPTLAEGVLPPLYRLPEPVCPHGAPESTDQFKTQPPGVAWLDEAPPLSEASASADQDTWRPETQQPQAEGGDQ